MVKTLQSGGRDSTGDKHIQEFQNQIFHFNFRNWWISLNWWMMFSNSFCCLWIASSIRLQRFDIALNWRNSMVAFPITESMSVFNKLLVLKNFQMDDISDWPSVSISIYIRFLKILLKKNTIIFIWLNDLGYANIGHNCLCMKWPKAALPKTKSPVYLFITFLKYINKNKGKLPLI